MRFCWGFHANVLYILSTLARLILASPNLGGIYLTSSDIQRYVDDYFEYGIDYTGDDNVSADDMWDFSKQKVDSATGTGEPMEVYWDSDGEKEY